VLGNIDLMDAIAALSKSMIMVCGFHSGTKVRILLNSAEYAHSVFLDISANPIGNP